MVLKRTLINVVIPILYILINIAVLKYIFEISVSLLR